MKLLIICCFVASMVHAAFGADCLSAQKQRCFRKSEVGGLSVYMQSGDPCFLYNSKRWCFVNTSGNMQMCTCTPECGCTEAVPPPACDNALVPKNPDCSADKTGYCSINTVKGQHTMCKYCGVNVSACNKVCLRDLTAQEKTTIVAKHNELRRKVAKGLETKGVNGPQPSSSQMYELVWSDELATIAQRWADQCQSGHDTNRNTKDNTYVGQNIASSWSSISTSDKALNDKVQAWYDEVKDWPAANVNSFSETGAKGTVGHYTQLVWGATKKVGCGFVGYVDNSQPSFPYKQMLVCNYAIGGNMLGSPVYKTGAAGSACPSGDNDKLCKQ